jgi:hypothetical protein
MNNDSGLSHFAFHIPPESDFSISRNPYSPFPGTLIHMPRIPHMISLVPVHLRKCATKHGQTIGLDLRHTRHWIEYSILRFRFDLVNF